METPNEINEYGVKCRRQLHGMNVYVIIRWYRFNDLERETYRAVNHLACPQIDSQALTSAVSPVTR